MKIAVGFAAILFAVTCAASDPQRDVVSSYYPDDLATGRNLTPGLKPGLQQSDYVATEFAKLAETGTGPAYLVAAYSNGWRGAIRVLHFDGTNWSVAAERSIRLAVILPSVELRDLDDDGVPEVAVTYKVSPGRSEATWLFRWSGSTLVSLWDPSPANVSPTTLPAPQVDDYVDLDGDGQIEVVTREVEHDGSESDDPDLVRDKAVYTANRLVDGTYQPWKKLLAYESFVARGANDVRVQKKTFDVRDTAAQYLVRLVRSGFSKSWSIRSAEVRLNGAVIADASAFAQGSSVVMLPVGLQSHNVLTVTKIVVDGADTTKGMEVRDIPSLTVSIERR
jgi:hypothetical protein